jgi:hypothetical protein
MGKKLIISTFLFLLLLGGLTLGNASGQERKDIPIIQDSFAAKEINPYDTWKIYLKASAPNGNMRGIYAVVEQPGIGPYPLSITRLKGDNQKEFSGYVYLNSAGSNPPAFNYTVVNLTIWVKDGGGNFSEPVHFTTRLNNKYTQAPPPEGRFGENELGPIMVILRTPFDSSKSFTF